MVSIRTIRRCIRTENYQFTDHARIEMQDDDLETADIERAILHGKIEQTLTEDPRGPRYVVVGRSHGDEVSVVCRLLPSGKLRIITVWAGGLDEK